MARDPETLSHVEWLGYVQPVGLVVSIPALLAAQAHINRNITPDHQRFLDCLPRDAQNNPIPEIRDLAEFTQHVLGWRPSDLQSVPPGDPRYASIEVPLPEYNETLRPTHVVCELEPTDPQHPWMMLIHVLPTGTSLDDAPPPGDRTWHAPPQARFERLLRETRVPIGLLCNPTQIRLVYAPRGETSGYATFSVAEMAQIAGRPIFAALHMLLCEERLFSLGEKQRLPAILADSRKYQNVVSTQLAEQVLSALFELLRGFQAADDQRKGELLREVLADDPNQVYSGLLTVLMRLVFILYAEDRGLLSSDPIYANYYSVTSLFERLRADAGRYPDTMDQRYGAWAQLLTLFRLIYDGGSHAEFHLPPRKGYLFDPDRYPFLEGRAWRTQRHVEEALRVPRVADGVVFRVLTNLLILDGERLSYRTLDVEQIGSVYEAMMGFDLEVAKGRSIAIKPVKSHGAPTTINLEELLAAKSTDRTKWLTERTDQKITGQAAEALNNAGTIDDLLAALEKRIAHEVTPSTVPIGAMIFQPSDERRRSGSHYTPRTLTEPIVRKTLEPILSRLGNSPTPAHILDLRICDPAMGSGAFLVEACRQLGDVLVKSWHLHDRVPRIPPDEDEILHARRLIAQRCLYGVDKNAMAVDLSKLSLWLATLAKDHPFTFLDHALRHGDSLVGLTRKQIADFHWLPAPQRSFGQEIIEQRIKAATGVRQEIIEAGDDVPFLLKQQKLALADESLNLVRFAGNLVIAAFFGGDNDKQRKAKREELLHTLSAFLQTGNPAMRPTKVEQDLRSGDKAIHPFHWEIEFPEVFSGDKGGFDAIVGNPPFLGGKRISAHFGGSYRDWLAAIHEGTDSNADLVAHFFRRVYNMLGNDGAFGLIATNSIAQGHTRSTGLARICASGGRIYSAEKRLRWPGQAAVVVSVVHVIKLANRSQHLDDESRSIKCVLNGRAVSKITAFLVESGGNDDPASLVSNQGLAYHGCIILGSGFLFEDSSDEATPIERMNAILDAHPEWNQIVRPYLGGEEVASDPRQMFSRYVIDFGDMSEEEARHYPELFQIVEEKVRPQRSKLKRDVYRIKWWLHGERQPALRSAIAGRNQVLVNAANGIHLAFVFQPANRCFSYKLNVFCAAEVCHFAVLQSRPHEVWARMFGATLKDDLAYNPTDCFETFPFPKNIETDARLETVGNEYYDFRAALMVKNNEGLTKTYNRFHDPNETSPDIKRLRELHATMDRTVLDAYGWADLQPTCEFLLDYEEDENDEDESSGRRQKKKPWRYRWPDEFRDTVLARLLEFNKQRAEQECLSGEDAAAKETGKTKRGKAKKSLTTQHDDATLFEKYAAGGDK
jgi:hypothetical protein